MTHIRCLAIVSIGFVGLLAASCSQSNQAERIIAGSEWLDPERGGGIYDVLVYPLTEDELVFFEFALAPLEAAAKKYPKQWEAISQAEDPVLAASPNSVWKDAGLLGEDVIAVSLKLTFLVEFGSTDEPIEAEMRENLAWLERRLASENRSESLMETANNLRALLEVVEVHREAEAFAFYDATRDRIDAALDQFTSIEAQ